ncbi:unnamed protein product [Linum tenue]|uniref:TIR domain-containing protein n=1 Tax=Linum tenue TaxID=586396 RepID=A0AAV0JE95_9ROSI|nr:unnamed protein product [Linum tenue]
MEPDPSSSSSSIQIPAGEYEVFLSFRGPDVRNTFADHLYNSLARSKIRTFRDEEELRKGEGIAPSLVRAILESKIYIPILTKQYASSKWCLQELAQMVDCWKQEKGHLILPIFYFVDPRDARHQQGPYEEAFEQHAQKHSIQTVEEWKEALREVGQMKGWHVTESHGQGGVVEEVLSKVELHLRSVYTLVTDELVGIDAHVEEVMKLLNLGSSEGTVIVGIHGMGGIGKTTLSKAVYNKICKQFDRCCYLEDVRETLAKGDGVVCLQNKVISSILKDDCQVKNVSEGINVIKERVAKHRVLLVIDDIDDKFEFDRVFGKLGDFSLGSRFICTTRDKRVLDFLQGCKLYEPGEMSHDHSLRLFSKHAYGMEHPPEALEDAATLCEEFVKVAAGLPLALKVIGSLLFRRDRRFWEEKLIELQDIPSTENKVQERLKISYKELSRTEKQIFLDIACLFIGMDKEIPYYMWSGCDFHPESGINTLIFRSLLKIDEENGFWMHDHIRDLGRAIVIEEDIQRPYRRSRIWSSEKGLNMLMSGEGNDRVEVLRIQLDRTDRQLTNKDFKELSGLRYLEVQHGRLKGDFSDILPNLSALQLYRCKSIPTDLNTKKLAVLHLEACYVTDDWRGWKKGMQAAHKLKVINLPSCFKLTRPPDLLPCKSLEVMNFEDCSKMEGELDITNFKNLKTLRLASTKLTKLVPNSGDSSIRTLRHLREIDVAETQLQELPVEIDRLPSLEILNLIGIFTATPLRLKLPPRLPTSLKRLSLSSRDGVPNLIELKELESLKFLGSCNLRIPGEIWQLTKLKELTILQSPCDTLLTTTMHPAALPSSLTTLDVQDCGPLKSLPSLANLHNLTFLSLKDLEAPEILGVGELRALETLVISEAPNLKNLDGLQNLLHLTCFRAQTCAALERLPNVASLTKLGLLIIGGCPVLAEIPGLELLTESLYFLKITECPKLQDVVDRIPFLSALNFLIFEEQHCPVERFPDVSRLGDLTSLAIHGCWKLTEVAGLGSLSGSLISLTLEGCTWMRKLPDGLSGLRSLQNLHVSSCVLLVEATGIERLASLRYLTMSDCYSMKEMPDLSGLASLAELVLKGCVELREVKGIEGLESLRKLLVTGCRSLQELGDLSGLKNLSEFDATGCELLRDGNGVEAGKRAMVKRFVGSAVRYGMLRLTRFVGISGGGAPDGGSSS